jgi:hypothetical protein
MLPMQICQGWGILVKCLPSICKVLSSILSTGGGKRNNCTYTKKLGISQVLVAHACNPSYSGCRDQEDQSLKPAPANSSQYFISKKPITRKRAWWSEAPVPLHMHTHTCTHTTVKCLVFVKRWKFSIRKKKSSVEVAKIYNKNKSVKLWRTNNSH